jgi:hypothetical protein
MRKPLRLRRQPVEALQPIDEEAANGAAPHRLDQPVATASVRPSKTAPGFSMERDSRL